MREVLAEVARSKSTDLVGEVEGGVRSWRVELLHQSPVQLEAVGLAYLAKLRCQGYWEPRHQELVEGVGLEVEVEAEVKVGGLGLVLRGQRLYLSAACPSRRSPRRVETLRSTAVTPFHDEPIVSRNSSKSCLHFLKTAIEGAAGRSGIL